MRVLGLNHMGNVGSRAPLLRVRKGADGGWTATVESSGPEA